ncbi:MAG: hypothetical protein V7752_08450 [Halopseudomonas sp.]
MQKPSSSGLQQRKRVFVDSRLQGRMLVVLVLLEVTMLLIAMIYLYSSFSTIIDTNLFTIHRSTQTSLLPEFLKQMGWVVLVMSTTNTLALFAAHALWAGYIDKVILAFRLRLERIGLLNLRSLPSAETSDHSVLDGIELWRVQEQVRLQQVRLLVEQVARPASAGVPKSAHQAQRRELLLSLRRLLISTPGATGVKQ